MIIPFRCDKPGGVTVTLIVVAEATVDTVDVEDVGTESEYTEEAEILGL